MSNTALRVPTRIVLRPIGSPLPLGFFAFGVGIVINLVFVAPLEVLACLLGYAARDTAGGTTMGLFAATWVTYATFLVRTPPDTHSPALGAFFLALATCALVLAITAIKAKPFFTVLLGLATLRFALGGLAELGVSRTLGTIGAAIGLPLAVLAVYGGLAFLLEDQGKHVLPLFRRGAAARAIHGDLEDQLEKIEREPGVRQQL